MPAKWDAADTFHLGINMAGAVSAGAYTAGVLDFLMEALEEWYAAKASPNPGVPLHRISLDVFSGASAGGMCAAIAAVMVQGAFQHIRDPFDSSVKDTTNKFYESWVNKVDIEYLLQERDLGDGKPVISLLDSTIIDDIANYALVAGIPARREYISDSLTLFLSLTNVRGTPFSLSGSGDGSAEEQIAYYADKLQFETVAGNAAPVSTSARPLPLGSNAGAWPLLKEAAKATGAFPIFLAPRQLKRVAADYINSPWEPLSNLNPDPVRPLWTLDDADEIVTLNVDGGVTDNDPFQLAHDYLAIHNPAAQINPKTAALENPRPSNQANCAVLTVAPFPSKAQFEKDYDFAKNSSIFGMLPNLFTTLISQSRFFGESLSTVSSGNSFSRFVLAPSDASNPGDDALQCGLLGAFGGFFWRGFRAHDYQLGRRNCQKFLVDYFRLAHDNPIIAAGLNQATRAAVLEKFDPKQTGSLPIVPLCGTAVDEVKYPERQKIPKDRVAHIVNWAVDRMHAVTKPLLASVIKSDFDCWAARSAADTLISTWGKSKLKEVLQKELAGLILD
jgi:predicted acylesterase/phospholipase RssA